MLIKVMYVSDSEPEVECALSEILSGIYKNEKYNFKCVESKRLCMNAYGKQLSEEEFEALDPESDEAWFDDYSFTFEIEIKENEKLHKLYDKLENYGFNVV